MRDSRSIQGNSVLKILTTSFTEYTITVVWQTQFVTSKTKLTTIQLPPFDARQPVSLCDRLPAVGGQPEQTIHTYIHTYLLCTNIWQRKRQSRKTKHILRGSHHWCTRFGVCDYDGTRRGSRESPHVRSLNSLREAWLFSRSKKRILSASPSGARGGVTLGA